MREGGPGAGRRLPDWMRRPIGSSPALAKTRELLSGLHLHTVCQEARCPNLAECFGRGTATFLVMGPVCTRRCAFCAVPKGRPQPLDGSEPERVADAVARMGLAHAVVTAVPAVNELELTGMPGHEPRIVRQRLLSEILEARAREFFQMVRDNLRHGGVLEALGAGCVLTGGGARLGGMLDTAESMLRVPARVANPVPLSRMPAELAVPECSTLVGMLLYAHRTSQTRAAEDHSLRAKLRAIFAGSV